MSHQIAFIDTSVLCNLVPVPGFDQHKERIRTELGECISQGFGFILPITTVIETGNHIAHLSSGGLRREVGQRFVDLLTLVKDGKSPWVLHTVGWDEQFLGQPIAGADTGMNYVEHAIQKVGAGDLCILTERVRYQQRTGLRPAIWSIDSGLTAHAD